MSVHGRLSRPIRRCIVRMDRKTRNADLRIRCRLVLKMADGMSAHAAARAVGCAPCTAWRVATRFKSEGESGCSIVGPKTDRSRWTTTCAAGSCRSCSGTLAITASDAAIGRWKFGARGAVEDARNASPSCEPWRRIGLIVKSCSSPMRSTCTRTRASAPTDAARDSALRRDCQ